MESWSTSVLVAVFLAAVVVTWTAGIFLSDTTDVVDDRFDLGEALGGLILLGIAGTLPEIAITVSGAIQGNLGLVTGNLLGGIAMQTLVLVLLDAASRSPTPLSSLSKVLEPIIEAIFVIILVTLALLGPLLPASVSIGPVSPISILIVITWFFGLLILNRLRSSERWSVASQQVDTAMVIQAPPAPKVRPNRYERSSTRTVIIAFIAAAVATLVAGVLLEQTSNQLADRWGINGVVFGATILAAATALPEISTGLRAVRLGQVGLAMGDIFGGNQVQMTLFLLADLIAGKPVLQTVSASSSWLGGIGVVVTALFLGGLVMRPPKKVFHAIGPDSLLVVVTYIIGLAGLVRISS